MCEFERVQRLNVVMKLLAKLAVFLFFISSLTAQNDGVEEPSSREFSKASFHVEVGRQLAKLTYPCDSSVASHG